MNLTCRHIARLNGWKASLLADERGAVALEMPVIFAFLLFSLLLPLADVAIAGFQYISAMQALRAFGQSIQYSPPSDFTNASGWVSSAVAKADPRYPIPISTFQLLCGDANDNATACTTANAATSPTKYYSYSTSITLAPIVSKKVLCTSGGANPCTFTLSYSERFQ